MFPDPRRMCPATCDLLHRSTARKLAMSSHGQRRSPFTSAAVRAAEDVVFVFYLCAPYVLPLSFVCFPLAFFSRRRRRQAFLKGEDDTWSEEKKTVPLSVPSGLSRERAKVKRTHDQGEREHDAVLDTLL